ncbi:MAG TPA: hypothetical protein VG498_19990 [Terriglobales bacterium]|nr:hypothetical protein [Terriglobales bacterium]
MKNTSWLLLLFTVMTTTVKAQYTFTSIDYPGGTETVARGINNHGDIVGSYRIVPPIHALLFSNGNFIPLAPTTALGANYSDAFKSNDRGDVVGYVTTDDGFSHGFLLSGGNLTMLDFPGASNTVAVGINEADVVVGWYDVGPFDEDGNPSAQHGFIWSGGNFVQVDVPGASDTGVTGINARGDLVGGWDNRLAPAVEHGFVYANGTFTTLDVPVAGSTFTQIDDINAQGDVVGAYEDGDGHGHGFVIRKGIFTTLDFPGAVGTNAWGINSAGQVVGRYHLTRGGATHGFLAEPEGERKPE